MSPDLLTKRARRIAVAAILAAIGAVVLDVVPTAAESREPVEAITNPADGYELVRIPAGEFWMGSLESDRSAEGDEVGDDERPRHKVFLDAYAIGKYEVTAAQYRRFCAATGRTARDQPSPAGPDHPNPLKSAGDGPGYPAVNVTWNEARAYCEWAGLRLPTEAEWEKAARGGAETRFFWGVTASRDRANYDSDGARPVGSYPPNRYGVFDTAGNVWEWVADWYSESYYAESPGKNPPGPASGGTKVHRGGSWMNYPYYLRPAIRYSSEPDRWSKLIGFRCAATP